MDLDLARKRILAGEQLTLDEHRQLLEAWRARRANISTEKRSKAKLPPKALSLDDLMSDFGAKTNDDSKDAVES